MNRKLKTDTSGVMFLMKNNWSLAGLVFNYYRNYLTIIMQNFFCYVIVLYPCSCYEITLFLRKKKRVKDVKRKIRLLVSCTCTMHFTHFNVTLLKFSCYKPINLKLTARKIYSLHDKKETHSFF